MAESADQPVPQSTSSFASSTPDHLEALLRKSHRAVRLLSQCNRVLVRATEEQALLQSLCHIAVENGGYRMAWVGFAENDEARSVRPVAQFGFEDGYLESVQISWADNARGRGPTGTAIRTGQPVIARNIPTDPAYDTWRAAAIKRGYVSSIALPLIHNEHTFGMLAIYAGEPDAFDEEEVELLRELADDLAYGICTLRARLEAREVAEALKESESRYERAVLGSNAGIWDYDLRTGEGYPSPRWKHLLGFADHELPNSAATFFSRIHLEDRPRVEEALRKHFEARIPYDIELRMLCKDGSYRWFSSRGQATWDADGKPIHMAGSITDITERKQIEQSLRESEERHRQIVEHTPDIIFVNRNDRIVYINPSGVKLLGAPSSEALLDRPVYDLFHPDCHVLLRQRIQKLRSEPLAVVPFAEERMLVSDGTIIDVEVHAVSYRNENEIDIEVVCRDITERKRAERLQRENEQRLQLALEIACQGLYDVNVQTGEATVTPGYATMLGYDPNSFEENHRAWIERMHPQDREPVLAAYRSYLAGDTPSYRVEFRQRTQSGEWKWILSSGRIVERDAEGAPLRMLGAHIDVTSIKEKELEIAFQARRAQALLDLPRLADEQDEREFLQSALSFLEELTGSAIGFIHYVNEDQDTVEFVGWSRSTLAQFCTAMYDSHYPLSKAGIWADAFRQRQPVVFNDYEAYPHKRGLPVGHAVLHRLITIPVIELGKVRMMTGVGNKATDYTPTDVETVQLLSEEIWRIVRRRRDNAALHSSEERYRVLFASNPHPMWVYDAETLRFLAVNQEAIHHYGYSEAEYLSMTIEEIRPPEEIQRLRADITRRIENPVYEAGIWKHLKKDGTLIDVEIRTHCMQFDGRPAVVALAHDVTQRIQAEQQVRQQLRLAVFSAEINAALAQRGDLRSALDRCARAMVQHLDAAFARIWTLNRETQVLELQASAGLYTNLDGKYARIAYGQSKIGSIARERRPFLSNDLANEPYISDHEWAKSQGLIAHAGYPLLVEDRVVGVIGMFSRSPIPDSILTALASVANAIAVGIERKRAEEETRRVTIALESSADGIMITDRDGVILWVNPALTRISGFPREELLGKNPRLFKSDRHQPEFYSRMWETVLSGNVWRGEIQNRRKDGSIHFEELTISPIIGHEGKITQFVAFHQDISRQKQLEAQFQQSQKLEAVGRLAGGVAHDFNNLLTVINGYSEIVMALLPPQDPKRESIKAIHEAGERAASLTRQLLAFSRQSILEPKVLDLNAAVKETEKMLRRLIGEDILLTTVLDPTLRSIKVDPGQLTQVVMNLAVNARDAMPRGGKLTIVTENIDLDASYCQLHPGVTAGPYVLLSMSDTGCGMNQEVQRRLFEPFFTTKPVGKGTGLGLAVVHGILVQSGGHVAVESEPSQGTTFKLYFPAIMPIAPIPASEPMTSQVRHGTETILLVEDEDGVRGMALMALQLHGYNVLAASDAHAALRIVGQHHERIDLLVTDVVMPGMSGRELADQLTHEYPRLKVLFMSGYTDDAVLHHGLEHEKVAFLQKPFAPVALAKKVRAVLDDEV